MGSANGTLSFYECRFSGRDAVRWWGHSTLHYLFENSQVTGRQRLWAQAIAPLLAPEPPGETYIKSQHIGMFSKPEDGCRQKNKIGGLIAP